MDLKHVPSRFGRFKVTGHKILTRLLYEHGKADFIPYGTRFTAYMHGNVSLALCYWTRSL